MSTTAGKKMSKEERRAAIRAKLMRVVKTDDPIEAIRRIRKLFEVEDRGIEELPPDVDPETIVDAARGLYESDADDIQIDQDAEFCPVDRGVWVSGWMFVDWDEFNLQSVEGDDLPSWMDAD